MPLNDTRGLTPGGLRNVTHPVVILDDFESGSLDSAYGGDTGSVNVTSNVTNGSVEKGTYALEGGGSGSNLNRTDLTVEQGDTLRIWGYSDDGSNTNLSANYASQGTGSNANCYKIYWRPPNDQIGISDEAYNTVFMLNQSFSPNTWYVFEVNWKTDGTHALTTYDSDMNELVSGSGTDNTYTSGGIGYRLGGVENYAYWDHYLKVA